MSCHSRDYKELEAKRRYVNVKRNNNVEPFKGKAYGAFEGCLMPGGPEPAQKGVCMEESSQFSWIVADTITAC
ncbi:hypothetical protein Tco_0151593 [Tanacetum coccineum]